MEEYKVRPFNHQPYERDPKTGRVMGYREYSVHTSRAGTLFEEPVNSGLLYDESGKPTVETVRKLEQKKRERELRAEAEKEIQAKLAAEAHAAAKPAAKAAPVKANQENR